MLLGDDDVAVRSGKVLREISTPGPDGFAAVIARFLVLLRSFDEAIPSQPKWVWLVACRTREEELGIVMRDSVKKDRRAKRPSDIVGGERIRRGRSLCPFEVRKWKM